MKTKWTMLVAVMLLLSMLCSCAAKPATTPSTGTPDTTTPTEPADESADEPTAEPMDESADEPANEPVDEPADSTTGGSANGAALPDETGDIPRGMAENTIGFPICEPGEITLEYWRSAGEYVLKTEVPFSDNYAWAAFEEATGIHVDFNLFSAQNYATQYSLMLTSQDYPDVAVGGSYSGGGEQAVEDDVYVDLANYVEEYAPNYLRWVNLTEGNRKNAYTDSGIMYTFCQVYDRTQSAFLGYAIRQDWLDDLGLQKPATINEWHDVLVAFRDEKTGGAAPLDIGMTGFSSYAFLEGAWNVSGSGAFAGGELGLIQKDGVVSSSLQSEGFRSYLETMRSWYVEGLICRDFPAVWLYDADRLAAGESGMIPMFYTQAGDYFSLIGQAPEDAYFTLLDQPVLDDGTERHIYGLGEYSAGLQYAQAVVFADSDILTEAIRWCDYFYTEPGYMMSNYGVEGVTFNYDENGHPRLTELVANNPDIPGIGNSMEYYLIHNGNVVFLLDREEDQQSAEALTYNELWNDRGDWNLSGLMSYTAEEGEERSALATDLGTLVTEFTCKVIMGETELNDDSWNTFQSQLKQMGLDRVIEITQASYSRYLAR